MMRKAKVAAVSVLFVLAAVGLTGCGSGSSGKRLVVNSAEDTLTPPSGAVTLRSALESASSGDTITFDPALNGAVVELKAVADEHTTLKGEVYSGNTFTGYEDRDYGRSALFVRKSLEIDASGLSDGITLHWSGDPSKPARVLAVYGDLVMRNVTVRGGRSVGEALSGSQPFTLARGAGLAVWGRLVLRHCTVADNRCEGDTQGSRDRGTYGGGIYANGLYIEDSVIAGNSAEGYGAAGGGIYSVGGADNVGGVGNDTRVVRCAISGNRVTAQHAYGGGIFTLSGGPNNLARMTLENSTVARNLAEDHPGLPEAGPHYYRGGGIYMGGGSLTLVSCTVAENEVNGHAALFGGKPNMGGGGIAATIGNAHTVEDVIVRQSIVTGNRLNGSAEDWFVGSLLGFYSQGYNLFGVLDFSQILAPVPDWMDLNRKHYPMAGDRDGVALADAINVGGAQRHATVRSAGTDAGQPAVLWYPPAGPAVNRVPGSYTVEWVRAGYTGFGNSSDDFLNYVLAQIRSKYADKLGAGFGTQFGDLTGTTWYGPRVTWPSEPANAAWIAFWQNVDTEIAGRLGPAGLGDAFWGSFSTGALSPSVKITVERISRRIGVVGPDQRGSSRPSGGGADVGAIEL